MEQILKFDYNIEFDQSNPYNQVILWKIENYNSYLTDFTSENTFIKFITKLEGKDVIFTYYTDEKILNVENLTNDYLIKQLEPLWNENISLYDLLSKIESIIENMPEEDVDEDDADADADAIVSDANVSDANVSDANVSDANVSDANVSDAEKFLPLLFSNVKSNELKVNQIVSELNSKIGIKQTKPLTVYDTTVYDDYENKPSNPVEIKCKLLSEITESETDLDSEIFGLSNETNKTNTTNGLIDANDDQMYKDYLDKIEQEYISDIIIQNDPSVNINLVEQNLNSDPYELLILSDSDFSTFYENLNCTSNTFVLNEKEILNTSLEILKSESPITDENMLKYAFTQTSIIKMLIKEVIKTNTNPLIRITPVDNNIFKLNVVLNSKFWTNDLLLDTDVKLTLELPKLFYPYAPPQVQITSPNFSEMFLFSINSLDYLKQENWNPSNTIAHTLEGLVHIINSHAQLDCVKDNIEINSDIIQLWSFLGIKSQIIDFKIDFTKLTNESNNKGSKVPMASGTGYGNDSYAKFDMKKFINDRKNIAKNISESLLSICSKLEKSQESITIELIQTKLSSILHYYLFDVNIFEITNKIDEYNLLIRILELIQPFDYSLINTESGTLEKLVIQLDQTCSDYIKLAKSDPIISQLQTRISACVSNFKQVEQVEQNDQVEYSNPESYDDLKALQFEPTEITNFSSSLKYETLLPDSQRRVIREFSSLKKSLPFNYETSVFFRFDETSMNKIKFLITGPKDTPYQDGCYIFDMILPSSYPKTCPNVKFMTTGKGSVRFNPNLYNCGKVCLSLLGTWGGRPEEAWNENSTMLQLFVSIQSLILIDQPYFNEPGYQSSYGTPQGISQSTRYNSEIQANNIKWAIIDSINNPDPCFADIINTHFKLKKKDILNLATEWSKTNSKVALQMDTLKSVLAKL